MNGHNREWAGQWWVGAAIVARHLQHAATRRPEKKDNHTLGDWQDDQQHDERGVSSAPTTGQPIASVWGGVGSEPIKRLGTVYLIRSNKKPPIRYLVKPSKIAC